MSDNWQIDNLPDWFEFRVGFTWLDETGYVCILLGWEPEAKVSVSDVVVSVSVMNEKKSKSYACEAYDYQPRMTVAVWYHSSWCMHDLRDAEFTRKADMWQPLPANHPHAAALMTRSTSKYQWY